MAYGEGASLGWQWYGPVLRLRREENRRFSGSGQLFSCFHIRRW